MMSSFRGQLRLVLFPKSVWCDESRAGHSSRNVLNFVLQFAATAFVRGAATDFLGDMRVFLNSFFKQLKTIILTTEEFPIFVRVEHDSVGFGTANHLVIHSYKSGREGLQNIADSPALLDDDRATMYRQIQHVTSAIEEHKQIHREFVQLYQEYRQSREARHRTRRGRAVAKRLAQLGVHHK